MTTNAYPILPVWNQLADLCRSQLKTPLNLKHVVMGSFASQPTPGLINMVNGIWIHPTPSLQSDDSESPRVFMQKHNFRLIYLRKMALNENPTVETAQDAVTIANLMCEKFTLPDITNMPDNAQILWMSVKTIEFEPQEDDLVATIAADIRAVAVQLEVNVRVRAR